MRRTDREVTEKSEVTGILERADSCCIALNDGEWPYTVILNYGYTWEGPYPNLYFHCAQAGKKLDLLGSDPRCSFSLSASHELERGKEACDWGMKFESVSGRGILRIVSNDDEKKLALDSIMTHHGGKAPFEYGQKVFERTVILRLDVSEISGKKKS